MYAYFPGQLQGRSQAIVEKNQENMSICSKIRKEMIMDDLFKDLINSLDALQTMIMTIFSDCTL